MYTKWKKTIKEKEDRPGFSSYSSIFISISNLYCLYLSVTCFFFKREH